MNRLIGFVFVLSISSFAQNLLVNGDFESGTVKGAFSNGQIDYVRVYQKIP